ncbi:hypothetical protein [Planctomyces sp. SH-PL62]|uniref:hypothetical protein n=1 Tax=Planctomyces sp. SH-PL62 TaxID=1636152 RepID=UPI00078C6A0F|nr:hypothetical protein [Planctomyces sp. SH-PL62]AMV36171.1 hypothetical protein VT85_01915 [Planctomyces sp. SH-PL62]
MDPGFSVSLNPIAPWPWLVVGSAVVVALTIAAYARKLRGPGARWRWLALGLRLFAVLLCLLAAMRPSVILQQKKQQAASVIFLVDSSSSMKIQDEANSQPRWKAAEEALKAGVAAAEKLGGDLEVKTYRFDSALREPKPDAAEAKPGAEAKPEAEAEAKAGPTPPNPRAARPSSARR